MIGQLTNAFYFPFLLSNLSDRSNSTFSPRLCLCLQPRVSVSWYCMPLAFLLKHKDLKVLWLKAQCQPYPGPGYEVLLKEKCQLLALIMVLCDHPSPPLLEPTTLRTNSSNHSTHLAAQTSPGSHETPQEPKDIPARISVIGYILFFFFIAYTHAHTFFTKIHTKLMVHYGKSWAGWMDG